MRNKFLLVLVLSIFLIQSVSADIWVSPKNPMINGNNYVFITYNNSLLANTNVQINITNPNSELKKECNILLNEYGFGRCKYNFNSSDISGTWDYAVNNSVYGNFEVGKITIELKDKNSLTSIKYGQKTTLEVNLSYENLMPKEIIANGFGRDLGTIAGHSSFEDLNSDGVNEIIVMSTDSSARIFIWGNFSRFYTYGTQLISGYEWETPDMGGYAAQNGCVFEDFNQNGNKTMICTDSGAARVLAWKDINMENGGLAKYPTFNGTDQGDSIIGLPTLCDVNNDSISDQIGVTVSQGNITIYNYSDTGGFTRVYQSVDLGSGGSGLRLLCNDFDDDGYNEWLAVIDAVGYYFADVNLSNINQITLGDQATDRGTYYGYGNSIDFDKDEKIEAVVPVNSGRFQVLEYNKSGTNELEEDFIWSTDTDYGDYSYGGGFIEFNDLNKNGKPDFIVTGATYSPYIIFTEANESNSGLAQEVLGRVYDTSYIQPAYVDFDGDGLDEIMTFGRYSGNTYIYKFNGDNWSRIYEGWKEGKETERTGDGFIFGTDGINAFNGVQDCIVGDFDEDSREEAVCFSYSGGQIFYDENDLVEGNVSSKINVQLNLNEGFSEDTDKYTDIRILNNKKTLCMKNNIAYQVTDIVDEDNQNQGSINSLWTNGKFVAGSSYVVQTTGDYSTLDASTTEEAVYSRIKLPQNYSVGLVKIWNYFSDGRSFNNVISRTTNDSTGNE
jgi:hypothetical protein